MSATSLERLMKRLPNTQPAKDARGFEREWSLAESELGFRLPNDYKDFICTYGGGGINIEDYIIVFSPLDARPKMNLKAAGKSCLESYEFIRSKHPKRRPLRAHPEQPGVYPWGCSVDGEIFLWLMDGEPANWCTVVADDGRDCSTIYAGGFVQFLEAIVNGDLDFSFLPDMASPEVLSLTSLSPSA